MSTSSPPAWTPIARKRSQNLGEGMGRMTAWVAFARHSNGHDHMISGRPHDAPEQAKREASVWIARSN